MFVTSARFLVTTAAAAFLGSSLVGAAPTGKRVLFKDRPRPQLVVNGTTSCVPAVGNETLYNIFAAGNTSAVWEWIPNFYSGNATSGGTVFVSGTDSPEDGAYSFLPVDRDHPLVTNSTTAGGAFRLNLADRPRGQHCIVAQDGRVLTTGSCENDDSIFFVTCSNCSSDAAAAVDKVGAACRIRAAVAPPLASSSCTSWAAGASPPPPGVPGYGPVGLRTCKDGMKGQEWDLVEATTDE
ncbi:hypothetical protein JCM11491_003030 [Sporobolomyces phaffii]